MVTSGVGFLCTKSESGGQDARGGPRRKSVFRYVREPIWCGNSGCTIPWQAIKRRDAALSAHKRLANDQKTLVFDPRTRSSFSCTQKMEHPSNPGLVCDLSFIIAIQLLHPGLNGQDIPLKV